MASHDSSCASDPTAINETSANSVVTSATDSAQTNGAPLEDQETTSVEASHVIHNETPNSAAGAAITTPAKDASIDSMAVSEPVPNVGSPAKSIPEDSASPSNTDAAVVNNLQFLRRDDEHSEPTMSVKGDAMEPTTDALQPAWGSLGQTETSKATDIQPSTGQNDNSTSQCTEESSNTTLISACHEQQEEGSKNSDSLSTGEHQLTSTLADDLQSSTDITNESTMGTSPNHTDPSHESETVTSSVQPPLASHAQTEETPVKAEDMIEEIDNSLTSESSHVDIDQVSPFFFNNCGRFV